MQMRLVDKGWDSEFKALIRDGDELRIVCPFLKSGAISRLLTNGPSRIQVVTRFNLDDFSKGVSDVSALKKLLDANAEVRGIKNLHAKLYLFGSTGAIITSANLTEAALDRNHEFGVVVEDADFVNQCRAYFDHLWRQSGEDLCVGQVEDWDREVTAHQLQGGISSTSGILGDFGVDLGWSASQAAGVPENIVNASQAFVKVSGKRT